MKSMCMRIGWMVVVIALTATASRAATVGSRFDPNDYTTLGDLTTGPIVIDTDAFTVTTNGVLMGTGVEVANESGNVKMALLNFDSIDIGSSVTITVTGNRDHGLVLGSQGDISIAANINVEGKVGSGTAGGKGGPGAEGGARNTSYTSSPPDGNRGDGGNDDAGPNNTITDGIGYGGGRRADGVDNGNGGGYGGMGSGTAAGYGGSTYGNAMLTDLYGGSGGGGSRAVDNVNDSGGGGGGGAIELTAVGTITLSASLLAGGNNGGATAASGTDRGGGGGSGGGILLNASNVVLEAGALLSAEGGDGGNANDNGAGGGGGRIAIYSKDGLTLSGALADVITVARGAFANVVGANGTIFIDAHGGILYASCDDLVWNEHSSYTGLTTSASSTLGLGGTNVLAYVTVSNGNEAVVAGTLKMDIDGASDTNDTLVVTNGLTITGATLDLDEISAPDDDIYVLAEYNALTGTFATTNDLPAGYALMYAHNGNQIALVATNRDIDVSQTLLNFGSVPNGSPSNLTVSVSNVGSPDALTITGVATTETHKAMFTITSLVPASVVAGGSSDVVIQYIPAGLGAHNASLEISSDDPDEGTVSVTLNGTGIALDPEITLPVSATFGQTGVGYTSNLIVSVANNGAVDLTLSPVSLSGDDAGQFTLVSYPTTVIPLTTSNIVVQYHPDNATILRGDIIHIGSGFSAAAAGKILDKRFRLSRNEPGDVSLHHLAVSVIGTARSRRDLHRNRLAGEIFRRKNRRRERHKRAGGNRRCCVF